MGKLQTNSGERLRTYSMNNELAIEILRQKLSQAEFRLVAQEQTIKTLHELLLRVHVLVEQEAADLLVKLTPPPPLDVEITKG